MASTICSLRTEKLHHDRSGIRLCCTQLSRSPAVVFMHLTRHCIASNAIAMPKTIAYPVLFILDSKMMISSTNNGELRSLMPQRSAAKTTWSGRLLVGEWPVMGEVEC